MSEETRNIIDSGRALLGIELGSTRIKAVLTDAVGNPLAQGSHTWENKLVNGLWTYSITDIWQGLQDCYASLRQDIKNRYATELRRVAAIGISAMMHGYMAFDDEEQILVPFRTWRNTNTGPAARQLSELFSFNVPLRWSISHLYECILEGCDHVSRINYLTTLAGYIHWQLTGRRVLGVGDASGMFPIDPQTKSYDALMVSKFDALVGPKHYPWRLLDILPTPLCAGADAGVLTEKGARLLDKAGLLEPGIPLCPPEGDAGTGMVATNSVRQRTGNVSCGTSSFSMIVLEKSLSRPYRDIDIVTTPDGSAVAMVHCNNCTGEINAWTNLFAEVLELMGDKVEMGPLFERLFLKSLEGDTDCGGLISYNYLSGEPITGLEQGRPLFVRSASDKFTLANFMRSQLYAAVGALRIGHDILVEEEHVRVDRLTGHGGYFTTAGVGQRYLAAALGSPISCMTTAGEGGAWGIALLAAYQAYGKGLSLPQFLDDVIFNGYTGTEITPTEAEKEGFNRYMRKYRRGLAIEQAAVKAV